MQIWKAHYIDQFHDTDIEIRNKGCEVRWDRLSFTLDEIDFVGSGIGDFELAEEDVYPEAKDKFHIINIGGDSFQGIVTPNCYELERYALDVEIPVKVVRVSDHQELEGILFVSFEYREHTPTELELRYFEDKEKEYHDDAVVHRFELRVDEKIFTGTKRTLDFEEALLNISKLIAPEYYMKCCFTCQYSDYSPYGNDSFGTMLCYKKQKEDYLKVHNKREYFHYLTNDYEVRQETDLCMEYDIRMKCEGYRGFVTGILDIELP